VITAKRRTVYVVRGKCAKECENGYSDDGFELVVPSARACGRCGEHPTLEQIDARAGLLFERDFGEVAK
jgi:hypothetical protein